MIIPVRCFSCGRVIATDYIKFREEVEKIKKSENRNPTSEEINNIFDELGVKRYCCRRMIVSHIDLIDEVINFD
ncbi:MAG: DNA-directed RNA polymerase subunit N [Thermoplasmata archaeon]|jgi:DNA-directed RNA polymerase subunit N|nr:DNA-directed RNA polymerase subunit N [Thermoplasmata archaeon]MVT13516.1 DNA-directed RNA polymerase subunit N [Euryarchaeota archaeon]MVT14690.1 DNA-directed RNA polymerase subunit N [Euryarchaeota archaeon]MVT35930.1 DNA-directed RNA polymerase subunit N [Euryarchaeota archaeon]